MAFVKTEGLELYRDADGTPVKIGDLLEVGDISATMDTIDDTSYDDSYRSYAAGIRDGGDVSITVRYHPGDTEHTALKTAFESGTVENFELRYNTATNDAVKFDALITSYGFTQPVGDRVTRTFTAKITGTLTETTYV